MIVGLTAALFACGGKEQTVAMTQAKTAQSPAASPSPTALPPGHPPLDAATPVTAATPAAAPAAGGFVSGKILETMNAGGYTYMRLATADGDVWTAVRETKVKKGQSVTVEPQMVAEKFRSASLNRTFDKLVMGSLAGAPSKDAPMTAMPAAMPNAMGSAAQHMTSASDIGDVNVNRAEGGLTIAETWSKRNELKDKPVVIRGKVVKFLGGIMGKNWIHLRDGSGSRTEGNDDITVTTNEVVKIGDVVTVSGTVHVDKDFGAGYLYPVIVEEASLQK
jgi:hypothetical protein